MSGSPDTRALRVDTGRPPERIAWIDSGKGIGIVLVVWGHAIEDTYSAFAVFLWSFHMPLFFFLAGTTAVVGRGLTRRGLVRSMTNLLVPYVVFSLVAITLWLAFTDRLGSAAEWVRLLREMAYGIGGDIKAMRYDTPLWFFTCLLSVRLLFIAITRVTQVETKVAAAILAMAVIAHVAFALALPRLPWNLDVALVALVFYLAGHRLRQFVPHAMLPARFETWAAVGLAVAAMLAINQVQGRVDMNGRDFGAPPLFYACAFLGIFVTLALAVSAGRRPWIEWLGRASIVIFPVHLLWVYVLPRRTFGVVYWYGQRLFASPVAASLLLAMVQIGLCLPVYLALARWAPELIGQRRAPRAVG